MSQPAKCVPPHYFGSPDHHHHCKQNDPVRCRLIQPIDAIVPNIHHGRPPIIDVARLYHHMPKTNSPRQSGLPCEQRRSRQMIEWLAQSAPRRDGPRYSCGATMAAISFWRSASSAPAFTRARLVGEYAASRPRPSRCLGATSVQSRPPPNPKIATLVLGHAAWGVTEPRASARRELFM